MSQEVIEPLDQDFKQPQENYQIYLESTQEVIYETSDIQPFINLSKYITIFVNDVKNNRILIPEYVDKNSMNMIIKFIEIYSNTTHYKNNTFTEINIRKPVQNEFILREDITDDIFEYVREVLNMKKFKKFTNVCLLLDIPILVECISAFIALEIKYLTKKEISNYFDNLS